MIEIWIKKKNYRMILWGLATMFAGIGFMILPELMPIWFIRLIGFTWILEGISWLMDVYKKKLEKDLNILDDDEKN